MTPDAEPGAATSAALQAFDATGADTFAWLCRLAGGDRALAEAALGNVYLDAAAADGHDLADVAAAARRLSSTHVAQLGADREHQDAPSITARAVLDLGIVQGRSDEDVATMTGLDLGEVTTARRRHVDSGLTAADAGEQCRQWESWFDDATRAEVRRAIATGTRRRPESGPHGHEARAGRLTVDAPPRQEDSASGTPTRSRRLMAAGSIVGIAAVLALGAAWVSPDDGADESALTLPSSTTTTDAPATTTTVDDNLVVISRVDGTTFTVDPDGAPPLTLPPGYVIDTEATHLVVESMWENAGFDVFGVGTRQLWATPGATVDSGRWIAVATETGGNFYSGPAGFGRVLLASGRAALVRSLGDDVLSVETESLVDPDVPAGLRASVSVLARGFTLDEVGAAVDDLIFSTGPQGRINAAFGHAADRLSGLVPLTLDAAGCCGLFGEADGDVRSISYSDGPTTGTSVSVTTTTVDQSPWLDIVAPFGSTVVDSYGVGEMGGRTVVWATGAWGEVEYSTARWFDGSSYVEVSQVGSIGDLSETMAHVERGSTTVWRESNAAAWVRQRQQAVSSDWPPDNSRDPTIPVGTARVGDVTWSLLADPDATLVALLGSDSSGRSYGGFYWPLPTALVTLAPSLAAMFVVVAVEHPPVGAAVRISVPGRDVVVRPITILDSGVGMVFDAYDEIGEPTVELVSEDGTVLATLYLASTESTGERATG